MSFCISCKGLITGLNLDGIHERYEGVLEILAQKECSLTKAMKIYDVARNTIRDYIGICELKIIDADKYKTVVQQAAGEKGKASVKSMEKHCRVALGEYRAQANKMKAEGKLLPFYPNEDFYNVMDSHMKGTGVLVVSLRGVNFGFWSRLWCSGQNVIIFSRQGLI